MTPPFALFSVRSSFWTERQPELRQPFLELSQKLLSVCLVLEARDEIIVADYHHVPSRHFLAPNLDPQVEHIVQLHIGQQR